MSHSAQVALCFVLILLLLNAFPFVRPSYSSSAETVEISDEANLHVYVIDLDGVGNRLVTNRSEVVEGVLQAAGVPKVTVPLFDRFGHIVDYIAVNVTVTAEVVTEWNVYRSLVEIGSNAIIVNAHDEYLPIPNGYSREQWVEKIADFMLNRSGTWVHTGGYPMNLTWHENGQTETWGEEGFQALMNYIEKGDVNCSPPSSLMALSTFSIEAHYNLAPDFYWWNGKHADSIATFSDANLGYPLRCADFGSGYLEFPVYEFIVNGELYWSGAVIRFFNDDSANFGLYVHLGSWQFYDGSSYRLDRFDDLAIGYIPTAMAVWSEVGIATTSFFNALDAIEMAKKEGRTSGLVEAESLLQQSASAYNSSSFKMSVVYAEQAAKLAEEAMVEKGSALPFILATAGVAVAATGFIASSLFQKRKKEKC
jgi:hypothetical protein